MANVEITVTVNDQDHDRIRVALGTEFGLPGPATPSNVVGYIKAVLIRSVRRAEEKIEHDIANASIDDIEFE